MATQAQGTPDTGPIDYPAKVKDLEEKLLTLKIKRAEDGRKIQEMERIKIQNQQLLEFKKQILESRAELQKQLVQAKKDAEEAIADKARHAEEMKDLAETAEIACLDKEMAEEKYEQLLKENETLKEKLEEISIDFELLKSEIDVHGDGVSNAYEVKQLQQQNARYNEAIIKLRDILSADKVEIQGLQKDLKESLNQVSELQKLKEKYEKEISSLEENINELKEQIDDALGSQEMVEILTEKNLELEDKVKTLQEEVDDLDKIHEINEQLQEGARDTELELREELDLNRTKINNLLKKVEDGQEALASYESTIQKFRELVKSLRDENSDLRKQGNLAQVQSQEQQVENIEFKMRFAESKAFAHAVEMDLRRLEVTQYKKQIKLLSKFLPQSFFMPGGDHDAIQVLLFVIRMFEKCDIISRQIVEKYPLVEDYQLEACIDSDSVIKKTNETIRQQGFTRRLLFLLSSIQTILGQYTDSLKSCSIELYLKIASLYPELKTHEKTIDGFIELLKKDQFDETISLDNLEKALNYFVSLYNLHLADNKVNNCRDLLSNFVSIMKSGVDVSLIDVIMIDKCISPSAEGRERIDMLKTYLGDIQEFCKKIRRRLIADNNGINLSPILENEIRDCIIQMFKSVAALHTIRTTIVEAAIETSLETDEITLFQGFQEIDAMITQTGGFKFLEVSLNGIMSVCSQLSTGLQQGDFEGEVKRIESSDEDRLDPLEARAQYVTDQSGKLSEYKIKLESKENEINELKKALKLKISETSEMQIRKDLAEKKLLSATKSSNEKVGKLQAELDEHRDMTRRREREYEETLNHYQADIEALESERSELKEKVKILSKRTIFEGLTKSVTSLNSSNPRHDTSPSASLSPLEASYMQQISSLRNALKTVKDDNIRLQCRLEEKKLKIDNVKFHSILSRTKPLWYLKVTGKEKQLIGNIDDYSGGDKIKALYIKERNLINRMEKFRHEARMKLINQKLFDPDRPFRDLIIEDQIEKRKLQADYDQLAEEIIKFAAEKKSAVLY
ncbi:dynactin subunit 1-like [Panonychus citri]|uniref:dynactin subunit 1-like n=1 Tax=Panonychus citri TaxID=50023 RepID=UPI002307437D|nr:dynactin subunit 1-like [Panonychus citri]